jgi:hypothetical protein
MATSATAPAPTPNVAAKAAQEVASAKTGHDPIKPVRYAATFVKGAVKDGLNDMARYGRKGLWVGMSLGVIAAVALSSLMMPIVLGTAIGFGAGALGGGAYGFVTGGFNAVGRTHRGEKYAEDLIQRKKIQTNVPNSRADYRSAFGGQRQREGFIAQQVLERRNEFVDDFKESNRGDNYWQNLVSSRSSDYGKGF